MKQVVLKASIVSIVFILLGSCSNPHTEEYPASTEPINISIPSDEGETKQDTIFYTSIRVDFDTLDPVQFIELLKIKDEEERAIRITPNFPPEESHQEYNKIPNNWIQAEHVELLLQMIDNHEPTVPVLSVYADIWEFNVPNSTVCIEALRLLEGYTIGRYPSLWPEYSVSSIGSARFEEWRSTVVAPFLKAN